MFLIQILLPLYDNNDVPLPRDRFDITRSELVERFGGLTSYSRAPVSGLWKPDAGNTVRDDLVVVEIMADTLDQAWWQNYRLKLEARFVQEHLVVRAHPITLI